MEVDQSERWGLAALRGKGFCSVHFAFQFSAIWTNRNAGQDIRHFSIP